jgi:hypothetical protein
MGYTHYWRVNGKISQDVFEIFAKECEVLANVSGIAIVEGLGDSGTLPEFTENLVSFNGEGSDSHETFYFNINSVGFNFCKTQEKPYDEVVTACLILANYYFNFVEVSSDGDKQDWAMGIALFKKVFPYREIGIGFLK